jgi:hypothetical protein
MKRYTVEIKGSVDPDDESSQRFLDLFIEIMEKLTQSEWEMTQRQQ